MHSPSGHGAAPGPQWLNGSCAPSHFHWMLAAGNFSFSSSSPSSSILKYFNTFSRHNLFVHDFVSIVSSISGFPWFAAWSQATNYPGIERTIETKSCTNKLCLKKVLEGFDLLQYGNRGKRKECASVRLASSETKDCTANYYGNEDYGKEIMSKTKLESITWRKCLPMMDSLLKFGSCHPGTLAGRFRRYSVWFQLEKWGSCRKSPMYMHAFDTRRLAELTEAVVLQMTSQQLFINVKFPAGRKKVKNKFQRCFRIHY